MIDKLINIIPFIFPYMLVGEELSNILLLIIGSCYVLINYKYIKEINIIFVMLSSIMIMLLIINNIIAGNDLFMYTGLAQYINIIIYYFQYKILATKYCGNNIRSIINCNAIMSIIFIIINVCLSDKRLAGIFGYANTYGLLLLVIFIISLNYKVKSSNYTNIIFVSAILLTGSRTTIILLILFLLIYCFIVNDKAIKSEECAIAIIIYIIISKLRIIGMLLTLFIFITYNFINKIVKNRKKIIVFLVIISAILFIWMPNNTMYRLKNISLNNGSLQERLITYKDSFSYVNKNFWGKGLNSYSFTNTQEATAFYDNKYLHNSLLNLIYEGGWLSGIVFISIIIYLNIILLKDIKKDNNKLFLLSINIIMLHSVLEFDFMYTTITILLSLIVSFIERNNLKTRFKFLLKGILTIIIGLFGYLAIYESILLSNNVDILKKSINMPYKDFRAYLYLSDKLMESNNFIDMKENLLIAETLNNDFSTIKWNLAYVEKKMKNYDSAIKYQREVIELEKYYFDSYKTMFELLDEAYNVTQKRIYENEKETIKTIFYNNLENINNKKIYLPNQLPNSFEEVLIMEHMTYK